jgi:hypothetical protein
MSNIVDFLLSLYITIEIDDFRIDSLPNNEVCVFYKKKFVILNEGYDVTTLGVINGEKRSDKNIKNLGL